ncbi:hypothetical protein JB92DRAFT_2825914 [Gautieria morchelliformis]|nr:hypothetical protein JB92DRAFT_2825914 [Gautieria morchelliformis]
MDFMLHARVYMRPQIMTGIQNDGNIRNKANLIGPSMCCNRTLEQVFNAGFLTHYANASNLEFIAVEQLIALRPRQSLQYTYAFLPQITGILTNLQDVFSYYLNHTSVMSLVQPYLNTSQIALQNQKPLFMMETNAASCRGFHGLSDSIGVALWGLYFSLQMAFTTFSGAMMHVGGQNILSWTFQPFATPLALLACKKQWTVGPMYYVSLIIAEAQSSSNQSQAVDLFMNSNNIYTPGYT